MDQVGYYAMAKRRQSQFLWIWVCPHPNETISMSPMKNKPLIVCHLSTAHPIFDVRIFYKECRSLSSAGFDTYLVVQNECDVNLEGIHIVSLKKGRGRIRRVWASLGPAPWAALKLKASVVHFHDPELLVAGVILSLLGKKVVYDVHEDYSAAILHREWIPALYRKPIALLFHFFEKVCSLFFAGIIVATPHIGKKFKRNKTVVVQNFPIISEMSSTFSARSSIEGNLVSYVGIVSRERGFMEMIKAVDLVSPKFEIRLHIAGAIPSNLREAIKSRNEVGSRVIFHGLVNRTEVSRLLSQSRVGLVLFHPLPNHTKSQPNKLFEYMAAGIPVIVSNFPLWERFVFENECGICVDPLSPVQIAGALEWILAHPVEAKKMGENGRKAVEERFSWGKESKKLIDLYERLQGTADL